MVDWSALRREFPILQRRTYLNTCSLGALGRASREAVNKFLDLWDSEGASAWYSSWMEELAALRASFARLIHAKPEEVALAPNVSVALGSIASCINYGLKPKVVTSDLDFPTIAYQWMVRPDVKLDFVPSPDGVTLPPEAFHDHVDIDTGLVATSHVMFTSGYIQDLRAVADLAHEQGAYFLVDAYQSAGQVPIDVRRDDVDVLVSGGLKWLLGGPGVVYMYVRQELLGEWEPTTTGWFANAHQFEFDPQRFQYHGDARRFETGTPSMAAVYAARAGLGMVLDIGVEAIRRRTAELVEGLVAGARDANLPLRCPEPPERRAAIVMVPRRDPAAVVQELRQRNFVVDSRAGAVRISPYFYNSPAENEAILRALSEVGDA